MELEYVIEKSFVLKKRARIIVIKVQSCNALLHMLLVCIRKLSKIISEMKIFNFGCLSSWHSIFMWARMWESIVIVNAKRVPPSEKFGKHCFRQYWAGTRFRAAGNLIPIMSSKSLVMPFHSAWKLLCFQRIYIVILYYNFVHHSDDVAWSFPSLLGEWEINCFHPSFPPLHNTRVQCSDCRLICKCIFMMYVYRCLYSYIYMCVCVCLCT